MAGNGWRWFALVRSAVVATLFIGFTAVWLPWTLGVYRRELDFGAAGGWHLLGWLLMVVGFGLALWCVWEFAWTGRGTPAPFDPPRVLVVKGLYRYVRNPMYVGTALGMVGLWMLIGQANRAALWYAVGIIVACNTFILVYEEPVLRSMFGRDYEEYCRKVGRWWPKHL